MEFGAAFWINRVTWPAIREACEAAERGGFDAIWLDDHLLTDEGDPFGAKLEGWAALAAVSQVTSRATLGLLVGANTFRNPGLTAKLATTLDQLSGGRAILGIGGGWFGREHEAFGFDFGTGFGDRLDRLDESVGLIRRLLDGERVTHEGRYYRMVDAICTPRPIQPRLPIMIGGSGPTKTLRTTARYADLWNGYGDIDRIEAASATLRDRCDEIGRPFDAIRRTVAMDVVIRDDPAEARAAYAGVATAHGLDVERRGSDGSFRGLNAWGPPAAIADHLRPFVASGVTQAIWILRSPFDLETMSRLHEVRALLA